MRLLGKWFGSQWDRAVWSKLSLWYVSQRPSHWLIIMNTELTLAETESYMNTTVAFNSSLRPSKFSQEQKALLCLTQRAAQVKFSLEVRRISACRKNIKTSLSHIHLFLQLCRNSKGTLHEVCAAVLGQVQPWCEQSWLCQAQQRGCSGKSPRSAKGGYSF